jgi:hypothetical protein
LAFVDHSPQCVDPANYRHGCGGPLEISDDCAHRPGDSWSANVIHERQDAAMMLPMKKLLRVIIVLLAAPIFIVLLISAIGAFIGPLELLIIATAVYGFGLWCALKARPGEGATAN